MVLGWQVYSLTGSTLALGMLGLVEAIPSISLALFGGHVADRRDRGSILRVTLAALALCGMLLAIVGEGTSTEHAQLVILYAVAFVAGIARGFAEPASAALEAQVVPFHMLVFSSTLMSSCWLTAGVVGPLLGGLGLSAAGLGWMSAAAATRLTYLSIGVLYAVAWISAMRISPRPILDARTEESIWESISHGVRYVARDQVMLGSMALDLFAVLFGGAIALLPVFAKDILHVGPVGLGLLNAAPTTGALLTMLVATRFPPVKHAGRNLFLAVTGFGVAMIVFALSTSIYLSLFALFMSGVFDGVSVVIRRAIVRLLSPDHLRGRIASVSMIFIGSSNEIGAFESGLAATLLGTVRSVWLGGIATLFVVAVAAVLAPKLRHLSLDPRLVRRRDAEVDEALDAAEGAPP